MRPACSRSLTLTLTCWAVLLSGLPAAAATPEAKPAAAKPAAKPVAKAGTKPAARPTLPRQKLRSEARGLALAAETVEIINDAQLGVAARVLTGTADCEFNQQISVQPLDGVPGYFTVIHKGQRYRMLPRETATGAVRLEDPGAGIVWLQIPTKSMLMNTRVGQRLVDNCLLTEQRVAMRAVVDAAQGLGIVVLPPALPASQPASPPADPPVALPSGAASQPAAPLIGQPASPAASQAASESTSPAASQPVPTPAVPTTVPPAAPAASAAASQP